MPILFGAFIAAAVLVGWFTLTVKPSAARTNLFADLPVEAKPAESGVRSLGAKLRRFVPTGLVRNMERDLSQAGHPHGIDVPKLLGIQAVLIVTLVLLCAVPGSASLRSLGSGGGVPCSPVLGLQPALQAPGGHRWRRCPTPSTR